MKKVLILAAIMATALSFPAVGQVTYTYTGNLFTLFSCGPFVDNGVVTGTDDCTTAGPNANTSYRSGDLVSATLHLTTALGGNLNLVDVTALPGFSLTMSDGEQTLTSGTSGQSVIAQVSTDANGNITAPWNVGIFVQNGKDTQVSTYNQSGSFIDFGILACCDPTIPGNLALNQLATFPPGTGPGTWIGGSGVISQSFVKGGFVRATECCVQFVADSDVIAGGLNQPKVFSGAGSDLGSNTADAFFQQIKLNNGTTITDNGISVGAFSDSNQGAGFARGIAFATLTNNNTTPATWVANAVLNGDFEQDVFGLPNGTLQAGATIHVFDSDKFNAAVSAGIASAVAGGKTVDQAVGAYLLGGPTAQAGLDPSSDFGDLNSRLSGALVASAPPKLYSNGPFFPTLITPTLSTSSFMVQPGKSVVVMFDVVASGIVGGQLDWAIGTGIVNFIDTLQPAANFITDTNGNPVTGVGVVGEIGTLPAAPAVLALTPPTGSLLMENPYTVTATATDSANQAVPGAGVKFKVTSGPDAGVSGVGITDPSGKAAFTFIGKGGTGTDTIQASIETLMSNSVQVTWKSARCPKLQGYWKNNPTQWPVSSLTLGGTSYTENQLLTILGNPGGSDASVILGVQLIAAKLDVANGSDPTAIRTAANTADTLLTGLSIPAQVKTSSQLGNAMTQAATTLANYTNGQLTRGCTP